MEFKNKLEQWVELVNRYLEQTVAEKTTPESTLYKAMRYSLMAGGKRLRPVLGLAVGEMLGGDEKEILPYSCAVEMIHTYSLIHDDLPAMDNDDYRRGKLTNHKVFGEAVAVLAGDALLNFAFESMLYHTLKNSRNREAGINAMYIIAKASGAGGMIGGQVVDLESENKSISKETLEYMHTCKTGAIIKAAVLSAAVLSNANDAQFKCLEKYSECVGLAFQIKDDILDVKGNTELMGKKTGSDAGNHKSTFVSLYGLETSGKMLQDLTEEAVKSITSCFGDKAWFLYQLAEYLLKREK